jgi:hypothetical protein
MSLRPLVVALSRCVTKLKGSQGSPFTAISTWTGDEDGWVAGEGARGQRDEEGGDANTGDRQGLEKGLRRAQAVLSACLDEV